MTDVIRVEIIDDVVVISINRPHARNAINRAVSEAVAEAVDDLDARPDLRVGVLTGTGSNFSSGMDLKALLAGEDVNLDGRGLLGITVRPPQKPLIAAVEGWALAGGCEIALACDLLVAAEDAQFGIPEVQRGLAALGGGLLRLPRRLPRAVAMEMALTGDPISARRAHELGMVNVITEPERALDAALDLARRISANAPLGVWASTQIVRVAGDQPYSAEFESQSKYLSVLLESEDLKEGARAFVEKRPARWQGR